MNTSVVSAAVSAVSSTSAVSTAASTATSAIASKGLGNIAKVAATAGALGLAAVGIYYVAKHVRSSFRKEESVPETKPEQTKPEAENPEQPKQQPETKSFDDEMVPRTIMIREEQIDERLNEIEPEKRDQATRKLIGTHMAYVRRYIKGAQGAAFERVMTSPGVFKANEEKFSSVLRRLEELMDHIISNGQLSFTSKIKLGGMMADVYESTNLPAWAVNSMFRAAIRVLPSNIEPEVAKYVKSWTPGTTVERPTIDGVLANVLDYGTAINRFSQAVVDLSLKIYPPVETHDDGIDDGDNF